jgi:hypothetical protein
MIFTTQWPHCTITDDLHTYMYTCIHTYIHTYRENDLYYAITALYHHRWFTYIHVYIHTYRKNDLYDAITALYHHKWFHTHIHARSVCIHMPCLIESASFGAQESDLVGTIIHRECSFLRNNCIVSSQMISYTYSFTACVYTWKRLLVLVLRSLI